MRIQVKSLQGDQYIVEVQNDQTIHHVKVAINEQSNHLPIERQKLVFKGRTMQDSSLVGDYNLEEGCKVHLILQKEGARSQPFFEASHASNPSNSLNSSTSLPAYEESSNNQPTTTTASNSTANSSTTSTPIPQSRLEVILRERLAKHFDPDAVEKIMVNLQNEINADANSSSFDDLERLAKQKLNISNE